MKSQDTNNQREFRWYLDLLCTVYSDVADAAPAQHRTEFERDLKTIRSRFEHEGIAFLTKTLPSLGKAIDTALASGSPLQACNFAKSRGSQLPRFLGWLLADVFGSDGVELVNSSSIALRMLRQLTLAFKKLELPYSDDQVKTCLDQFIITDSQLTNNWLLNYDDKHTIRFAERLCKRLLAGVDPKGIFPRHGPGAVATREIGPGKRVFRLVYQRLEEVYPFTDYFFFSLSHCCDRLHLWANRTDGTARRDNTRRASLTCSASRLRVDKASRKSRDLIRLAPVSRLHCSSLGKSRGINLPQDSHGRASSSSYPEREGVTASARVVLVPKDSRGPRLISMEPLQIQWIQQGQKDLLVETLESHSLTRGQVNFSNQEVNRSLALEASRHGNLVTLDMKDASDRVSLHLVRCLFPINWVEALEASRSPETVLPNGETVKLEKFAPMGSAVCFPVEALCFWLLAVSCLHTKYPTRPLQEIAKSVWVYGDDIITYRKDYSDVMQCLERFGLLFNRSKCCTHGFFRESCGLDAHKGIVVTPVRFAKRWCCRLVVPILESWVAYSNALYDRGYYKAAKYVEEHIQRLTPVPYSTEQRDGLCFVRPWSDIVSANRLKGVRLRFSRKLHRLQAFGWTIRAKIETHAYTDWEELLRVLAQGKRLKPSIEPRMPVRCVTGNLRYGETLIAHALNEKSKGSGVVAKAGLYSLPRRVTSKRGWFTIQ